MEVRAVPLTPLGRRLSEFDASKLLLAYKRPIVSFRELIPPRKGSDFRDSILFPFLKCTFVSCSEIGPNAYPANL